jgi:hypothetical protein
MQRHRFKQPPPLELRLEEQAKRLRQEAKGTPSGGAETASHISQWVSSKRLQPPSQ